MMSQPFKPVIASGTVKVAGSTTTAKAALTELPASGKFQLRVHNASLVLAYFRPGPTASVEATSTDIPIPAGGVEVFTFDVADAPAVAVILASSTGDVYFTVGDGI